MIKRIIFDLDNTLIIPVYDEIFRFLSTIDECIDFEFAKNINNYFFEYEKLHKKYDKHDLLLFLNSKTSYVISNQMLLRILEFTANYKDKDFIVQQKVLRYLKSKGYELVLLTNWFREIQIVKLKKSGLLYYFDNIIFGDEILKPDLKAFELARGSRNYDECISIGDNLINDIYPALNLGMKAIYLNRCHINVNDSNVFSIKNLESLFEIL